MAGIIKMNINGKDYDIYGKGGQSGQLIAGDGIIIDPDGNISVDPDSVTDKTKALIAGNSEQIAALWVSTSEIGTYVGDWGTGHRSSITQTVDRINATVSNFDSEGGFLRKGQFEVKADEIWSAVERLTSEGKGLKSEISQSASDLTATFTSLLNSEGGAIAEITKRFKFDQTGLTISATGTEDSNIYTRYDNTGMQIKKGKQDNRRSDSPKI